MTELIDQPIPTAPPRSQWRDVWDQFKTHKGAMLGGIVFLLIVLAVFVGPWLWPYDATFIDIRVAQPGTKLGASAGHRPTGPRHAGAHDGGRADLDCGGHHRDAAGAVPGHV